MIEIRVSNEVDFWLKLGEALQLKSGNNNGIESRGFLCRRNVKNYAEIHHSVP